MSSDVVWGVWITEADGMRGRWMKDGDKEQWSGTLKDAKQRRDKLEAVPFQSVRCEVRRITSQVASQVGTERAIAVQSAEILAANLPPQLLREVHSVVAELRNAVTPIDPLGARNSPVRCFRTLTWAEQQAITETVDRILAVADALVKGSQR